MASTQKARDQATKDAKDAKETHGVDMTDTGTAAEHNAQLASAQETGENEANIDPDVIDRARLGTLLRNGQRLAQHVRPKVSVPEMLNWERDVQQFINDYGL